MLKTKLSLERLEDRDAPSGVDPTSGGTGGTTPPPDPGAEVGPIHPTGG